MTGPLRILSLEDDPQAFELIRATLASDQIACEWIYTEDRRGYVAALEEGNFDLILADYSLPSIDGRTALELALENRPEVPFIFVSGSLGEEVAIETLKSGATDYVLKDRLSRLAPAVRRALREAAEHRERLEAQRALRESEERYRLLIENSDDLVVETDSSGLIHYASPSHVRRLGNSPSLVGRSLLDFVHPEDHLLAREKLGLSSATGMLRLQHADGDWRWFDCAIHSFTTSVGARRVVFVSRDVTERRKADEKQVLLEAQLRQSQKLEAVGLLAGGVAHDFNNLLQVIIGYTLLAMDAATPANERSSQLTEVKNAADRASQLTRQLLAFSRRQPLRREATNLNRLVSDLLRMIRRLIGEHIEVHFKPDDHLDTACVDRSQIEQVLLNLCVNARDAMPRGGHLQIHLQGMLVDAEFAAAHDHGRPGRYVRLTVSDTGFGMDESVLKRIFEPFFSTKPRDQGTGLGLSVVYGIVKQHDGLIHVESRPGVGTTFSIYLPASDRPANAVTAEGNGAVRGGNEVLLVAEDEPSVRLLAARVLERAGYRVFTATNGDEAVEIFRKHAETIDLIVMDVVMPKMGGAEAARQVRALKPHVPVLFSSGYSGTALQTGEGLDEDAPILPKPYSPDILLGRVREMLEASRPEAAAES